MPPDDHTIAAQAPLVVRDDAADTGGEFVRFELTLYPATQAPELQSVLAHRRWSIDFPTEHVHPHQEERWEVLSGGLAVEYGGEERVLGEHETVTLPPGVPHRIWNPLDEPSRVSLAFHPALAAQPLTETLYVLAQLDKTNEKGHLHPVQYAVTQAAHPDHLHLTALPVSLQHALIRLLAPVGRRLGYQATYRLASLERDPSTD